MYYKNQDYTLFGTKIKNNLNNEIGLVIFTWINTYADDEVKFATCVDRKGKKYNIELDNITPLEDNYDY
ncbi:MAG: hypothetical protein R3Y28_06885 [Candidatus Gastranaerophilales bacterium]